MSDSDEPDDDADRSAAAARRLAEWVIVAGLILGAAAAAFLVWEAWSANREALAHNARQDGADILSFDLDGHVGTAPSDPGPPAGERAPTS